MLISHPCLLAFPELQEIKKIEHYFVCRLSNVETRCDRESALRILAKPQLEVLLSNGFDGREIVTGEQVHGPEVAVLRNGETLPQYPIRGVDSLITDRSDIALGVYVADCAPVFFISQVQNVIGLAHAGRRGTEAGIVPRTLRNMQDAFGCKPEEVFIFIGPCIRPPHYETDFAAEISRHAQREGVRQIIDCGICTASDLSRFYSYRKENGRTGRMLAVLALRPNSEKS
ncbi:MAG: polyphenol oxidase family protein [Chthoniobacterales bacterium]|nr:polyphenol oxidase family protein [Chthoniobacterales bacterium]